MISLADCIAMCGLDADGVAALAEHEHIPEVAAAALASYLLEQAGGPERIRTMMIEDIHKALHEVGSTTGQSFSWRYGISSVITRRRR